MMLMPVLLLLAAQLTSAQTFAITGATVADGTGAIPRHATVVVRDGLIASIGGEIPPGVQTIDATGHTLTPGFFDLHTHLPYSAVSGLRGDWGKVLKAYLACGVTTVVDFGTYPETFEPMRRLWKEGVVAGPRLHLAARLTTPGGHGAEGGRGDFFSLEVSTVREAREAARRWLAYQPDAIKVFTDGWRYGSAPDMSSMQEEVLAEIVKEAHQRGVEVLTHTVTLAKAKEAARSGVDVIAHGVGDARADAELIALMRKHQTTYASTLAVYEWKQGPMAPMLRMLLEPAALRILDGRRAADIREPASRKRRWSHLMANIALLREGAVRIGNGTDAGVTGTMHGWSSLREMQLLVQGGLSPLEALTAATGASAAGIKVDRERGTIEPGKAADLVLIQGEPHRDISHLDRITRVWLGGKEIDRAKLLRDIADPGVTPIPSRRAVPLIDDMESPGGRTKLGTLRVNATDSGHDHSKMMFTTLQRAPGNHVLSIQARMAEKARPYAQVWFPLSPGGIEPIDATGFEGIQFDARGDGAYRVNLQHRAARGDRAPVAGFQAGAVWNTVRIPFAAFQPAPALKQLQVIEMELAREAGRQVWLEVDNLRFY